MNTPDLTPGPALVSLFLPDEAATQQLGASLGACLTGGLVIWLEGDLGAGKTTLARALIQSLGHQGPVKSPTYSLVEVYALSSLYLYHFDFYRFESPEEFLDAGLAEYFNAASVCLVEWPEKGQPCAPSADVVCRLCWEGAGRRLVLEARSERGAVCVNAFSRRQPSASHTVVA